MVQAHTQLYAGSFLCPKAGGRTGFCQSQNAEKAIVSSHKIENIKKSIKIKTLTKHQKKPKTHKSKKNSITSDMLNVFSANANGLKNKVESRKSNIQKLNIGIFTVQESNLVKNGKLKIDDFEIF